jgi:DNA-binding MarR family transcriptional regulator
MPTDPQWLNASEDRAWRAFKHAGYQLDLRLSRHLLQDSHITLADYEVLAVLSESGADRLPARDLCAALAWEKSRLSHQIRGMQGRGLIAREPNPDDARSVVIRLLPAGRRLIEDAAPAHVVHVRRHLIDLFTPDELATLATLNERVVRHLTEEPFPEQPGSDEPPH